jgi:8-oxo-dGTP pyrophosphatase MutT (NUDIX family)
MHLKCYIYYYGESMITRKSSRAILLNEKEEVFLFKFEFASLSEHKTLWVTPGGGLEYEESFEEGLARELFEELGIVIGFPCKYIFYRNKPFETNNGEIFMSEERYYLVRVNTEVISFENMTNNEKKHTKSWRWWSLKDLEVSEDTFFADDLAEKIGLVLESETENYPLPI